MSCFWLTKSLAVAIALNVGSVLICTWMAVRCGLDSSLARVRTITSSLVASPAATPRKLTLA